VGDERFKQCAVVEFLTAEKNSPIDIQRHMQAVRGVKFVNVSKGRLWVRQLKQDGCITPVVSGGRKIIFQGRNSNPVKRWQKCTEVRRDYVEKRSCTIANKG
jgi:hypothetical protein